MLASGEISTHPIVSLALNPNPGTSLLAVTYLDGDLALLDPLTNQQLKCFRAECQSLAASSNGRLLASGGAYGIINVYEFGTLQTVYRMRSMNSYIKKIRFSKDSMLLADIRGSQCTIWAPESVIDVNSDTTSTAMTEPFLLNEKAKINIIAAEGASDSVFCGMDDGSITVYSRKTAECLQTIFKHEAPVRLLAWCQRTGALLSIDAGNTIIVQKVQESAGQRYLGNISVIFQSRPTTDRAITDILVGEAARKFAVSTRESLHLFNLDSGELEKDELYAHTTGMRKLAPHGACHNLFLCVDDSRIHICSWVDLLEVKSFSFSTGNDTAYLKSVFAFTFGPHQRVVAEQRDPKSWTSTAGVEIFDLPCHGTMKGNDSDKIDEDSSGRVLSSRMIMTIRNMSVLAPRPSHAVGPASPISGIVHVIGCSEKGRLTFLDRHSWACSVQLDQTCSEVTRSHDQSKMDVFRHFFVPTDWLAERRDMVCRLIEEDIALARGCDLVIIKGGFAHAEKVSPE